MHRRLSTPRLMKKILSTCTTPTMPIGRSLGKRLIRATSKRCFSSKAPRNCRRFTILWCDKPSGLNDALLYNRQLWTIFIEAVTREDNKLPVKVRDNLIKLGAFIMAEIFTLMTKPKPDHLKTIIKVNRSIATGLRGKA